MCHYKCFLNGSCTRQFPSGQFKVLGPKQIVYGPKVSTKAFYGDAHWEIDPRTGVLTLTEFHNIDKLIMKKLAGNTAANSRGMAIDQASIHNDIRQDLDNDYIYTALISNRINSLIDAGWITRTKLDKGWFILRLTKRGRQEYDRMVASQHHLTNPFFTP